MHDPLTVAFEIRSPFKDKRGDRNVLITIWHKDPCKDGTDDSCGWFMRARHGDKGMLKKIKNEFDFNIKHNYWFDKNGVQKFSTIGTLIQMYSTAAWVYFNRNKKKQKKFLNTHLIDIITFAENPVDCMGDSITNRWGYENHKTRFDEIPPMIYSDICRRQRKSWKHPKWHIHHWKLQFVFLNRFKRRNDKPVAVKNN